MAAVSPSPKNLLLLGLLGIGAFWYVRNAQAAQAARAAAVAPPPGQAYRNVVDAGNSFVAGLANSILGAIVPRMGGALPAIAPSLSSGATGGAIPIGTANMTPHDDRAFRAVKYGESDYYGQPAATDFMPVGSATADAAVRGAKYADPYYQGSADDGMTNNLFTADQVAISPAPTAAYSPEVYESSSWAEPVDYGEYL